MSSATSTRARRTFAKASKTSRSSAKASTSRTTRAFSRASRARVAGKYGDQPAVVGECTLSHGNVEHQHICMNPTSMSEFQSSGRLFHTTSARSWIASPSISI
jgi:hypothetical protein